MILETDPAQEQAQQPLSEASELAGRARGPELATLAWPGPGPGRPEGSPGKQRKRGGDMDLDRVEVWRYVEVRIRMYVASLECIASQS